MIALHKSAARSVIVAAFVTCAGAAAAQGPPAGEYICQALTPGTTGFAYIDTLTLAPGDEYSLATMRGSGRYRFDAAAQALVFLSGPFAPRHVGQYVPPVRGVPNIRIHESRRQSRQFDWVCALNRR